MASDTQNTYPGTAGGANVIGTLGNQVLEAFGSISNVGVSLGNQAGSILDTLGNLKSKYEEVFKSNKSTPPQQTTPDWQVNSVQDFVSDPNRVKNLLFYGAVFSALAVATVYIVKKF